MQHVTLPNGQMPQFYVRGNRRPPMTNAERQAAFRKRHPDYNRKYKAAIRAQIKAWRLAAQQVVATTATVVPAPALAEPLALPAPVALPVKVQLLLPAPVVMPILPGINTIEARPVRAMAMAPVEERIPTSARAARSAA